MPQFEDAYRDLFKHEPSKLPNRNMVALFDSFDNVIGRPFGDMTDAHKRILAAQAGQISLQARAQANGSRLIEERIGGPAASAAGPAASASTATPTATPQAFSIGTPRPSAAVASGVVSPDVAMADQQAAEVTAKPKALSLIHISEPTRRYAISYAVFCLKKKR